MRRLLLTFSGLLLLLLAPTAALAAADLDDLGDQWLPRTDGASWTYSWSNSAYQPNPRVERYSLTGRDGRSFRLSWDEPNPPPGETPSQGTMDFGQTDAGLVNSDYASTPPPARYPVLCAAPSGCGNSLAAALYPLIWGTRSPVLAEPLVKGTQWNSLGGASNEVASANRYVGRKRVVVPAFPQGIEAALVTSDVSQAGALGDLFGTGTRTVWWVRGVGPVRIEFNHASGETSTTELQSTSLAPLPLPSDVNLLPLNRGEKGILRFRNSRYMRRWSTQRFEVSEVVNNSSRVDVKHVKGPIRVAASYALATRIGGTTLLSATSSATTRNPFPKLGPRSAPKSERRHFFTPFDLMVYGFGPVAPPLPVEKGETFRSSEGSRDFTLFGVTGSSRVLGNRTIRVPAGKFKAFAVQSRLSQRGFAFGSGVRTTYFAPGVGLVKLVFEHRDGSVSTVERMKG